MSDARTIVAQDEDGQQVLVWLWDSGEVQVALRPEPGAVWGPPLEVIVDEKPPTEDERIRRERAAQNRAVARARAFIDEGIYPTEKERRKRALREFGIYE